MTPAKRPSAFRERMAQANTRPAPADAGPAAAAPAPAAGTTGGESKFTVLLDGAEAVAFDRLALDVRALLGRRASKGDLVRALVALAADDATLRGQLADELRDRPSRRRAVPPS